MSKLNNSNDLSNLQHKFNQHEDEQIAHKRKLIDIPTFLGFTVLTYPVGAVIFAYNAISRFMHHDSPTIFKTGGKILEKIKLEEDTRRILYDTQVFGEQFKVKFLNNEYVKISSKSEPDLRFDTTKHHKMDRLFQVDSNEIESEHLKYLKEQKENANRKRNFSFFKAIGWYGLYKFLNSVHNKIDYQKTLNPENIQDNSKQFLSKLKDHGRANLSLLPTLKHKISFGVPFYGYMALRRLKGIAFSFPFIMVKFPKRIAATALTYNLAKTYYDNVKLGARKKILENNLKSNIAFRRLDK